MLRPSTKGDDSENTSSTSKNFSANCYKANVDLIYAVLGLIFYTIFLKMHVSSTENKNTYGFGVIKWTFEIISGPWSRLSDNFAQGYLFLGTADQMSNATRGPLVRRLVKDLLHIDRLISICNLFSWWQSIFLSCSFGTPTLLSLEIDQDLHVNCPRNLILLCLIFQNVISRYTSMAKLLHSSNFINLSYICRWFYS